LLQSDLSSCACCGDTTASPKIYLPATAAHRIRSLDALHLAIAMDLQRSGRIDQLVTADTLQATIAPLEGVPVFNPLAP